MLKTKPEYDVVNNVPMSRWDGPENSKLYLINTADEWKAFYELLMQQKLVACDTETNGFYYFKKDRIVGLSFGWERTHFYIPVRHEDSETGGQQPEQLTMDFIRDDLIAFFKQEDVFTVWHNWKFDAHFYRADGIEILTPFHDTRILWHFFDENAPGALKKIASGWKDMLGRKHEGVVSSDANLSEGKLDRWRSEEARVRRTVFNAAVHEAVADLETDPRFQSFSRKEKKDWVKDNVPAVIDHPYNGKGKEDVHYGFVPVDLMTEYAALDTYLTWCVYVHVVSAMTMGKKLQQLYINEIKLSKAILDAEEAGVKIDRRYLKQLDQEYLTAAEDLKAELGEQLGKDVLLSSPQQLSKAFIKAGVPLVRKTDGSASCASCQAGTCDLHFQTDARVLQKLEHEHEAVAKVLQLRTVEKLRGTYVAGILDKITDQDILHCSFNQNVKTGRMSSTNPNLQNIPGRDTSIRRAFVCPDPEYVYLFCDYSQVEVRLTAHYSQDPLLLDAYAKNQDVHTRTMCEMFGHDYTEVSIALQREDKTHPQYKEWKAYRNIAKRINFGIIYGVGAPGLSEQIPRPAQYAGLSHKQWVQVCQQYIDQYLDKYLGVKRFINEGGRTVSRYSQVENSFGRVRHLPHAKATKILGDRSKYWLEARARRQGVNFLIQGTAADLFKTAVVRVHDLLKPTESRIVNFVHDEIQIYLHQGDMRLLKEIKNVMEDFPEFTVPIITDMEFSLTNWAEKESIHAA